MNKIGIILIHGAGLGSFIWRELQTYLEIPSLAVDFPNRENTTHANKKLNLNDYHDCIVKQVAAFDCEKLVVVAHSVGGVPALKLMQYLGPRACGFIAVGASIPHNGSSYLNTLPFFKRISTRVIIKLFGTEPPDFAIQQSYCNDLNQKQAEDVIRNYTAEAAALYLEKCEAGVPEANKIYIKLTNDEEFSDELQEKMISNLKPDRIIPVYTGHLPMMSNPRQLAGIMNEFVKTSSLVMS